MPSKKSDKSSIEQVKPLKEASVKAERVTLLLRYPVRYKYVSTKTDEVYIWNGAGSILSVHLDDAPDLLVKFKKAGCCGASPQTNFIFEEVK